MTEATAVQSTAPDGTASDVPKPQANEVNIRPIQVILDGRGLGIFIGRNLLEFAVLNGPYFNGPGMTGLKITDGHKFARSVGRQLTLADREDGSTILTRALDEAMLDAINDGCEGVEVTEDPEVIGTLTANPAALNPEGGPPGGDADLSGQ